MPYKIAKLFHLVGLLLWLGPSTGGFILMGLAKAQKQTFLWFWITREYKNLLYMEAAGLMILLATGLIMRSIGEGLREERWLKVKMTIVVLVFIPLEIIQAYIYLAIVDVALIESVGFREAMALYDSFNHVSLIVLAVSVPIVFLLAVLRPRLGRGGRR